MCQNFNLLSRILPEIIEKNYFAAVIPPFPLSNHPPLLFFKNLNFESYFMFFFLVYNLQFTKVTTHFLTYFTKQLIETKCHYPPINYFLRVKLLRPVSDFFCIHSQYQLFFLGYSTELLTKLRKCLSPLFVSFQRCKISKQKLLINFYFQSCNI